jgi:hypothetical protein
VFSYRHGFPCLFLLFFNLLRALSLSGWGNGGILPIREKFFH